MSKKYDDQIVRMGFDNSKFESGAKQTMSTLDKLNEKLKLKGATEGSENVQRSIDRVDFTAIQRGIEAVERRFSTMGIVGMNVIGKITDGIAGSVKQLEAATIGQIKSGGWSRAMNIANAKFQIEGLGFAWEEVEKAVSYGVKDTAYGLDAAASAASQLAASGVDFKKTLDTVNGQDLTAMHKSLRAISGVAAMTNSSYEDIARIFTTVAGNGRLMGDQLLQLSSRGMNAAAKLAEVLNTTEEEVRDMVSRGKIDFETFAFAMDDAFGAHAKEANKTFTGALGNMKAALSRVGEIFADPIINKTNTLFISLTERIDEFKNKLKSVKVPRTLEEIKKEYNGITMSATAYDQMLKSMDGRTVTFGTHFAEMWQSGIDAFSTMIKSVDISWFDKIVNKVDSVTVKIKEFFDLIKEIYGESAEEAADTIEDATQTLKVSAKEAQAAKDVLLKGMYGGGAERKANLTELFGGGEIGEKHAKNVQAYIDSVLAAGGDYEKAAIKVADASEEAAKAQTDMAHEVKKAKLKAILDGITGTFSHLWNAAKNVGKAASKIGKAILTAFSSVFKIDFGFITGKAFSFAGMIETLSEKLIVSDSVAKKITEVFTKFFEKVKTGIEYLKKGAEYAKGFAQSIGESELFNKVKDTLTELFEKIKNFGKETGEGDKKSGISFISKIFDAIENLVTSKGDVPSKLTGFINKIIDSVMSIKWGEVAKLGGMAFAVYNVIKLVLAVKTLGNLVISLANLPANISGFFFKLGNAVKTASYAYAISSAAKSLAIVAGAMVVLSQIPDDKLYKAIGTTIIIALVIKFLMKAANELGSAQTSITGIASAASSAFSLVKTMYAVATMIAAVASAVVIMSVGLAIIEKSGAAKSGAILPLLTILFALAVVSGALIKMVTKIDTKSMFKIPMVLTSMSAMFIALGSAVLMMSGAISILSKIPTESFGMVVTLLAIIFGGIALMLKLVDTLDVSKLLTSSVAIVTIGGTMSALMLSIATSLLIVSSAMAVLTTSGASVEQTLLAFVGIMTILSGVIIILTAQANNAKNAGKVAITLLSMSVAVTAIGGAAIAIATALRIVATIPMDMITASVTALSTIFLAMIALVYVSSQLKPTQMLASAVMFIGMAAAIMILSVAISALSLFGKSGKMLESAAAIFVVLIGIAAALNIAATTFDKMQKSAGVVIGGILVMTIAIAVIAAALSKLSGVENLAKSALALVGLVVAIGVVIAALTLITGKGSKSADAILSIGLAFIMISGALLIFALALETVAKVAGESGFGAAVAVLAVFSVVVIALVAVAALVPGASKAFEAVGKAFLYAGLGAALVGAAILLVCLGVKTLAPAIGVLAVSLNLFFTVLEEHKVTAIVVGVVLLAIIAGITIAIMKLSPVLKAIAETIGAVAKRIGGTLSNGTNKLKEWFSGLTVRGRAAIIALITTLCAAIMKASPTILSTIGKLLIKLLAFLGSIAGDLAMGLLDFLVNLINGLADAIRANSARIAAALWGVVISLVDLVIQIIGQLVYMILAPFSEKAANAVQDFVNSASDGINQYALEQRKAAEEADKNKRDYIQSMKDMSEATEESAEKSKFSLGSLTDVMKGEFGEQKSELDTLKEQYNDLPGYAYDAILRSQNSQNLAASDLGASGADSFLDSFNGELQHGGGGSSWDITESEGMGLENFEIAGTESGTTYTTAEAEAIAEGSDEMYQASDETMKTGAQQAVVDNKDETKKVVQENFNVPAQAVIRSGRQSMYDAAEYSVSGITDYIEGDGTKKYRSVMTALARAGDEAFRSFNKIESPSKLYYQDAAYIVQGITRGISQNTQLAEDSMTSLSDAIIVSFGNPIDYLSKIASGELIYDPSIRPVFDSSGLYRGASSIDSMLTKQTVSVTGLSGKLAADIGTLDRSNADVVNEIRALREDISYMEEAISEMQVVMDTGALVGTMVGPMDKELGRRAVYRGRGN